MSTSKYNPKGPAQQLLDMQEKIIALQTATSNPEQRQQLSTLRKKISAEAGRLIDASLDPSTLEYQEAAAGIENASEAVRKGINDVNSVQAAINALAIAADMVSKIAII